MPPLPSLEMRAKQSPGLRQMQRMIMSPQMQQAISILQMPIIELSEKLEAEIAENPLLESSDEDSPENRILEEEEECWKEAEEVQEFTPEKELRFDDQNFEILKRIDDDFRDYLGDGNSYIKRSSEEEKLKTFMESSLCGHTTLFGHLMMQARETFSTENEQAMAEAIIGNFDNSGFFEESLAEIALLNNFDEKDLTHVLEEIQHFEPHGVGARNLQESLLIQLQAKGKKDTLAYQIIAELYQDLLHNRIPQIQKALGCSSKELTQAIEGEIAKLELHPSSGFNDSVASAIVPDATVYQEDEKLLVSINDDPLPQLCFNRRYLRMLDDPTLSLDTRNFIKQKILSAQWFFQNIHQRNTTLERIAQSLAKRQYPFFSQHDGKLTPLTMKMLAEELNLHESTIARAVVNKYLHTPRGLFPLRYFFTNAYQSSEGEDLSSATVRDKLQALITAEDKMKPLSDEALSLMLQAQGICCARRTIAKYRRALEIGNAHQRKKFS
jgi:RNA polymerase sigma-54 factor